MICDGANDWSSVPYSAELQITEELTVMCWVKLDTDFHGLVSQYYNINGDGWLLSAQNGANNRMNFTVRGANGTAYGGYVNVTPDLDSGDWYQFAGVYSKAGGYLREYCNGVKYGGDQANANQTIRFQQASGTGIGSYYGNIVSGDALNGTIAHVVILNRAAGTGEIVQHYLRRWIPDSNTMLYSPIDEGSDNQAPGGVDTADISGNGNHGTFGGAPTWRKQEPPIKLLHE